MATVTKGKTFINGETVTPATLHQLVDSATVTGIVNADISASAAISDTKLATISTGGKVANSATTATNANTASAIVARDAFGNFSAGTITATLSGNATNVTGTVAVPNGGTGATTAAAARTSLGLGNSATLNTGTTSGTVATGDHTHSAATTSAAGFLSATDKTKLDAATNANTANAIVARDASGNFIAGTINATQIQINSESNPLHILQTSSNSAIGSEIQFRKTRGTLSSEQATLNFDVLGECSYYGRSATGLNQAAAIRVRQIANTTQNALAQIEFAMRQNNDGFPTVITFTNIGGATFNGIVNAQNFATTSDKTLKENIDYSIANSLQKVKQLKPAKFDFIQGDKNQFGFIAQDVLEVIPDLVVKNTNDKFGIKMMDLIPHLVSCIQELAARVEALEAAQP